jgi:hypothetical protein
MGQKRTGPALFERSHTGKASQRIWLELSPGERVAVVR